MEAHYRGRRAYVSRAADRIVAETAARKSETEKNITAMTTLLEVGDQFTVTKASPDKIATTAVSADASTAAECSLLERGGGPGGGSGGSTPMGTTSPDPGSLSGLVARSR